MKALTLTLERIFESDFNFNLSTDNDFSCDDIKKIRDGILLVINGDDTKEQGVATFSYASDDDKYTVVRNFDAKTIEVWKNDQALDASCDLSSMLFGIDSQVFEKQFKTNETSIADTFNSPSTYFENLLSLYAFGKEMLEEKCESATLDIEKLNVKLEYLTAQKLVLENNIQKDEENYIADIEKLESDIFEVSKMIFLAEQVTDGKKELEALNKKKEASKENIALCDNYKSQLEKNEKIENSLFLINKNEEVGCENEKLDTLCTELNTKLEQLQAECEIKTSLLVELEKECILSGEKLLAATNQFDAYVLNGPDLSDTESDFYKTLSSYYVEYDKKAETLSETYTALSQEYENLSLELSQTKQALLDAKYPSSVKKAVRDGLVLETSLASKLSLIENLDSEIDDANARIEVLKEQIARNNTELSEAKTKSEENLGKDVTYAQLYAQLNEDEKQKQTLYRNQIMIANTEREISAVDNKIYENEEAQRSYVEDKYVLENAKSTLLGYIKKLNDKLISLDEKLVLVSAQKKYHDTIDNATYGDKCPVCKGPILEKSDFSKESKLIEKAYNDLILEKQKAMLVKKDYDTQLEKINIRLGELSNRIDTSITYLNSLKETKAAKYDLIKNLLNLSRARSFSALTTMLDAAIKKVAITTNEFIEVGKFHLLETCLLRGIAEANSEIKHLEDVVLKNALSIKESTGKVIDNHNEELASLYQEIEEVTAEKKAIELTASEVAEEDLEIKIANLSLKESELLQNITKVEQELISIASRDNTICVEKDGENLTYPQLFASLLKDTYTDQFNLLKIASAKKQEWEDKYSEKLVEVKAKEEEIVALTNEIVELTAKKDNNQKIVDLLNENANFVPSEYNAQDIINEQLTPEKKEEMIAFIKENENKEELILAKIDALNDYFDTNKSHVDNYDENIAAKVELLSLLSEKRELLAKSEQAKANLEFVINQIDSADKELGLAKDNFDYFTSLYKNNYGNL